MAHIVDIKVAGLAGRQDVYEEKLDRYINVFFGLNGSGKTSLLKIMHSALSGDARILDLVPFDWAEVTVYSLDLQQNIVRKISKEDKLRENFDQQPLFTVGDISVSGSTEAFYSSRYGRTVRHGEMRRPLKWQDKPELPEDYSGGWFHRYLPTWRLYRESEYESVPSPAATGVSGETEYDWDSFFAKSVLGLWSLYSNHLLREVRAIQAEGLANILRSLLAVGGPKAKKPKKLDLETAYQRVNAFLSRQGSPNILGSMEEFQERYAKNPDLSKVVNDINTTEQRIEQTMASRHKLEQMIRDMFAGNKDILFEDTGIEIKTDEGKSISLALLSSGEKHALSLFIDTLLAEVSSIIIDEPEISLHIDWQNKLLSSMHELNPFTQIIVATHSPEIMADIDDRKIFRL